MIILLAIALALAGCGPQETPEPPTPTRPLRPTFTPTSAAVAFVTQTAVALAEATLTPTPTLTPTETPVPTETPTPTETAEPTATPTETAAPTNTPVPRPTNTPRPPSPPTATPPPAAPDPCASIGGDGCKFKMRGGPAFAPNDGLELKLTFAFIHSGRGGEAQGSYFVWLEKEGIGKLPIPDSVRSWTGDKRQGPNGAYNYEYKLGLEPVGGNVAGCYVGWVLDGNGERDSQNFRFCVPEGQGEVWIEFDQA